MSEPLKFVTIGDAYTEVWGTPHGQFSPAIRVCPNGDVLIDEAACEAIVLGESQDATAVAVCRIALAARDGKLKPMTPR